MDISNTHLTVQKSSQILKICSSKLKNNVSVHTFNDTITLSSIFGFQKIAHEIKSPSRSFIGSINGEISLSFNYTREVASNKIVKKKRGRDSSEDDADSAVKRVQRSGADAQLVTEATFTAARSVIASVLRMRGAGGEIVVESWAVSIRKPGSYGNISVQINTPTLVVGFRLSAGVAIPLSQLCAALSVCRDGLITTSVLKVDKDFDLPLTPQGAASELNGQKSILVLATIPSISDPPI
jgi:hypothetical protein